MVTPSTTVLVDNEIKFKERQVAAIRPRFLSLEMLRDEKQNRWLYFWWQQRYHIHLISSHRIASHKKHFKLCAAIWISRAFSIGNSIHWNLIDRSIVSSIDGHSSSELTCEHVSKHEHARTPRHQTPDYHFIPVILCHLHQSAPIN